jgi:hypothetical protein
VKFFLESHCTQQLSSSLGSQVCQHFRRMAAWTDGIIGFLDLPLFVNHVTDTFGIASGGILARTVGKPDGTGGVAEEQKWKLIFLRKGSILGHRIETDSQDFDVPSAEFVDLVAEPATFSRSTWGIGFRVKPQEDFLPPQGGEG